MNIFKNGKQWFFLRWFIPLGIAICVGAYLFDKYRIAPDLEINSLPLRALDGQLADKSDWENNTTLYVFFATWCGPCIIELQQLSAQQKKLNEGGIDIVAISDEPLARLRDFQQNRISTIPIYRAEITLSEIGINAFPTNYLISAEGEILYKAAAETKRNWADPSTVQWLFDLSRR